MKITKDLLPEALDLLMNFIGEDETIIPKKFINKRHFLKDVHFVTIDCARGLARQRGAVFATFLKDKETGKLELCCCYMEENDGKGVKKHG